jgi:signal transduction histidine kinase
MSTRFPFDSLLLRLSASDETASLALLAQLCRQCPPLRRWLWSDFGHDAAVRRTFARLVEDDPAAPLPERSIDLSDDGRSWREEQRRLRAELPTRPYGGLSRAEVETLIRRFQAGSVDLGTFLLAHDWSAPRAASPALMWAGVAFLDALLPARDWRVHGQLAKAFTFLRRFGRETKRRAAFSYADWWKVRVLFYVLQHPRPSYRTRELRAHLATLGVEVSTKDMRWFCARHGLRRDMRATAVNLIGLTAVLYVGTVFAWFALTYYRDVKERKLKAAELESLLHQAQLEALRSQLHPHFLFNTLHSIAELVHENPPLAEQLILRLAELLRKVLRTPVQQEVPLTAEVEFSKSYLEIEQMRLGDRLSVEWSVTKEALAARVPSLVLQPLIETAIQHGIGALVRPGRLSIQARRDDGFLHLQVRDTGPGLQPENASSGGGIGLANTRNRLERLYGDRHRFDLVNDNGLVVNVRIPFVASGDAATQPS